MNEQYRRGLIFLSVQLWVYGPDLFWDNNAKICRFVMRVPQTNIELENECN